MKKYIHSIKASNSLADQKYDVDYQGNWMQLILRPSDFDDSYDVIDTYSESEEGDIILYAESDIDPIISDGYEDDTDMYSDLKEQIIEQAEQKGIPVSKLRFYYDD